MIWDDYECLHEPRFCEFYNCFTTVLPLHLFEVEIHILSSFVIKKEDQLEYWLKTCFKNFQKVSFYTIASKGVKLGFSFYCVLRLCGTADESFIYSKDLVRLSWMYYWLYCRVYYGPKLSLSKGVRCFC